MISEHITDDIPPQNENVEYGYHHSNAFLQFCLELERCKPYKAAHHPRKFDVINDVKLFATVYCSLYCCKCLTLSNQTSCYKAKCIGISSQIAETILIYCFSFSFHFG